MSKKDDEIEEFDDDFGYGAAAASSNWETWLKNASKWRPKKEKGYSATREWSNRYDFGGRSSYFSDKELSEKYNKILGSITRSANVVRNSSDDEAEKTIIANWSDGKNFNSIKDEKVYISPDVCHSEKTRKKSWSDDERVDVLVGEVLTYSTMKRTAEVKAEDSIRALKKKGNEGLHGMAACLWHAAECLESEREVLSRYPGFHGYYSAFHDYYTDASAKEKLEEFAKNAKAQKLGAVAATLATEWEMLHPDEKLDLEPEYRELVDWATKEFVSADSSIKKAEVARNTTQRFAKVYPLPPSMPKMPGPGDGDEDGEGEDKKDGGGGKPGDEKMDGPWKPSQYPMVGLPRKRLNQKVKNDVDKKLPSEMVDCPDEDKAPEFATLNVKVTDKGMEAEYAKYVSACRAQINQLKSRLKLRNEVPDLREHGLRRGDLDEGSLYKLGLGMGEHALFEEATIIQQPKLAFGLLIDESGSMSGAKSQAARRLAVILANALADIKGVNLCVMGHTGEGHGQDNCRHSGVILHHYYTPEHKALASMVKIGAFCQNLDGYALSDACKHMERWYPTMTKYLVLISDGQPAAHSYGGITAEMHIGRVSNAARRKNTHVMGVGILRAYSEEQGARMYGHGNFVVLNGIDESVALVANFVSRVIRSSCALQG